MGGILDFSASMLLQDKLLTMDPKEITYEMVNKKLQEIVLSRGKKGIDRQDQVEMLSYLATVAKGPYQKVCTPQAGCHAHRRHLGIRYL